MDQQHKLIAAVVVAAAAVAIAGPAMAEYPEKPIKLIVPFRAGGGSGALARTIQAAIEKYKLMPKPFVVSYVGGAGGAIGARRVKDAKPDGYTFLQIHQGLFALAASGRIEFGPDAFEPVAQTTQSCVYLAVLSTSPFKTYQELIAYGRANPGKLKQADSIGGLTHFPSVLLEQATGAKFGIVQTGGTSKRFASLKGGHTQLAFFSPGWIKRGGDQLRGLLWLGPTRHPAVPDMPTAKDLGYDVESCIVRRFWAPKGTPADRIAYFAGVLKKVMETPELVAYHKKRLSSIIFRTGAQLKAEIDKEFAVFQKVAPVVKAAISKKKK